MQIKKLLLLFLFLFSSASLALDYGNPSADEQMHLEMINRARSNPLAEAARLSIDLFEGVPEGEISAQPVQPLSFNESLTSTARAHSEDMLFRNFFAHNNPEGQTPFDRITAGGYIYRSAGENLALTASSESLSETVSAIELHNNLFIDKDFPDRGHRTNILTPHFREIGVGLAFGLWQTDDNIQLNAGAVTTDFGQQHDDLPILLGVIYADNNFNQLYDSGEGESDIAISILETGDTTHSADAGGYGMELTGGDYLISFNHLLLGDLVKTVHIDQQNVKVDALISEFNEPDTLAQCATFINNKLLSPCLTVEGVQYITDLSVINNNPLTLALNYIADRQLAVSESCASYDSLQQTVHFPCVNVNEQLWWADLKLTGNSPAKIELISAGLVN